MTKANEICTSLVVEQGRALERLGESYAGEPQQLADAIDAYRDVIAIRLERLKDLGKPKDPPRAYLASLRAYIRQLERAPTADPVFGTVDPGPVQEILKSHRPQMIREERGYGIGECQALDAKPLPSTERSPDRSSSK